MKTQKTGYTYFIQMGDDGPVKIGFCKDAENLRRRVNSLQVASLAPLFLRGVIKGPASIERDAHRALVDDRLRGEWFRVSSAVAEWLEKAEAVDELPVVQRRSHDRLSESLAREIWKRHDLTYAQKLDMMPGWSMHTAKKHFGLADGRDRNPFTSESASAAAYKSWKGRKPQRAPAKEVLAMWRDHVNYPNTQELAVKLKKLGWSTRMMYVRFGGRFPELGLGRPRKSSKD